MERRTKTRRKTHMDMGYIYIDIDDEYEICEIYEYDMCVCVYIPQLRAHGRKLRGERVICTYKNASFSTITAICPPILYFMPKHLNVINFRHCHFGIFIPIITKRERERKKVRNTYKI